MGRDNVKRHPNPDICKCKRCRRNIECNYCNQSFSYSKKEEYYQHLESEHLDELTIEDRKKLDFTSHVEYKIPPYFSKLEKVIIFILFVFIYFLALSFVKNDLNIITSFIFLI